MYKLCFFLYKLKPFLHYTKFKFINIVESMRRIEAGSQFLAVYIYTLFIHWTAIVYEYYVQYILQSESTFNTILTGILSKDLQENITIEIILKHIFYYSDILSFFGFQASVTLFDDASVRKHQLNNRNMFVMILHIL